MGRIAIIPARSGSKGLKDKNILPLNGKPLLAYTIECAINSAQFDKVFVSTDSEKYAALAMQYGADASFLRSAENASDTAGSWDVVKEVVENFESQNEYYEEIMLLQSTSPLRVPEDIHRSIEIMAKKEARSVLSVTEAEYSPFWCNTLPDDLCMDHFWNDEYSELPRQLLPTYYRQNGSIYLVKRAELNENKMFHHKCYAYIMPQDRSIDIDTKFDFLVAELYMNL